MITERRAKLAPVQQQPSQDSFKNQFKRALFSITSQIRAYRSSYLAVPDRDLIPTLIADLHDPSRQDPNLNHIRTVLHFNEFYPLSPAWMVGSVSPTETTTKILTILAVLHNDLCIDGTTSELNPKKVLTTIQSLFSNGRNIRIDEKDICDVTFDLKSETLSFNKQYYPLVHFNRTPATRLIQDHSLFKFNNPKLSGKYTTGALYPNTDGICNVITFEVLHAEADAYNASEKRERTQAHVQIRNQRMADRTSTRPARIKANYLPEIAKREEVLREEKGFFKVTSIQGKSEKLPDAIRDIITIMQDYNLPITLCEIISKNPNPLEEDHAMALSIQKVHKDGIDYFHIKFTDPNTSEGAIILDMRQTDLQNIPDIFDDIYYFREQAGVGARLTFNIYSKPKLDDKDSVLRLLTDLTSHENDFCKNNALIQNLLTADCFDSSTVSQVFHRALFDGNMDLAEALLTYRGYEIERSQSEILLHIAIDECNYLVDKINFRHAHSTSQKMTEEDLDLMNRIQKLNETIKSLIMPKIHDFNPPEILALFEKVNPETAHHLLNTIITYSLDVNDDKNKNYIRTLDLILTEEKEKFKRFNPSSQLGNIITSQSKNKDVLFDLLCFHFNISDAQKAQFRELL